MSRLRLLSNSIYNTQVPFASPSSFLCSASASNLLKSPLRNKEEQKTRTYLAREQMPAVYGKVSRSGKTEQTAGAAAGAGGGPAAPWSTTLTPSPQRWPLPRRRWAARKQSLYPRSHPTAPAIRATFNCGYSSELCVEQTKPPTRSVLFQQMYHVLGRLLNIECTPPADKSMSNHFTDASLLTPTNTQTVGVPPAAWAGVQPRRGLPARTPGPDQS